MLETPRLRLRAILASDYAAMRRMHTDPEVMRYIAGGALRSEEQTRVGLEKGLALGEEHPGLGVCMIELREGPAAGTVIGNILLRPPASDDAGEGIEIGYALETPYWGRGYALEACRALIAYARTRFPASRIVALIDPEHEGSRKLLRKLGFRIAGMVRYRDPTTGNEMPSEILELGASA